MSRAPISAPARMEDPEPSSGHSYVSFGTVGHYDPTPTYAWMENGEPLVEVTLRPSGDQIIAKLDMGSTDEGGLYMPLSYGSRVVVCSPTPDEHYITGRVSDASWPFPESVAKVETASPTNGLPLFAFLKTGNGQLLAIETGRAGDIIIHSGRAVQIKANVGGEVLLTGKVRIGEDFASAPTPDQIGPDGEILPGVSSTYVAKTPGTNVLVPPATLVNPATGGTYPADGIMRFKDTVQGNSTNSPDLWAWMITLSASLDVLLGAWNALAVAGGGPLVVPSGSALPLASALVPETLTCHGASCSDHTCSDA